MQNSIKTVFIIQIHKIKIILHFIPITYIYITNDRFKYYKILLYAMNIKCSLIVINYMIHVTCLSYHYSQAN